MKKLRYAFEYALLRVFFFFFDRAPLSLSASVASGIGRMWFHLHRRRRLIGRGNVLRTGLAQNEAEADAIVLESYRHFALMVFESMQSDRVIAPDNWREHVELTIRSGAGGLA